MSTKSGIQLPHSTLLSRIRIAHDFIAIMVRQSRWSRHLFIFVEGIDTNVVMAVTQGIIQQYHTSDNMNLADLSDCN